MTFDDLPKDWSEHALTSTVLPDVIDLFAMHQDRMKGCLVLLILDAEHRLLQPITVEDLPLHTGPDGSEPFFQQLVEEPGLSMVVARGRRGGESPTPEDAQWATFLERILGGRLLGFYVATPSAVFEVTADSAAA